jgi:hypothetical protein
MYVCSAAIDTTATHAPTHLSLPFDIVFIGVSVKGHVAEYVENADLRARLINVYAGEASGWCKELVEILHTTYL